MLMGLNGGPTAWWDPDQFDQCGIAARVIKLHGSINWYNLCEDPLPRRIGKSVRLSSQEEMPIVIWPSSTKYQEAQIDPFAQLSDRARRALQPIQGSQRLLVICGYSFRDRHINAEIDRALSDSNGTLTIVAFTEHDKPMGKLKEWLKHVTFRHQVLVFAKRGFFTGNEKLCADEDLPWWKFTNVTRILEGDLGHDLEASS